MRGIVLALCIVAVSGCERSDPAVVPTKSAVSQAVAAPVYVRVAGTSNCPNGNFVDVFIYYADGKFIERSFMNQDGKQQLITVRTGTYEQKGARVVHWQIAAAVIGQAWDVPAAKLEFTREVKSSSETTFSSKLIETRLDGKVVEREPSVFECTLVEGADGPVAANVRSDVDPKYFNERSIAPSQQGAIVGNQLPTACLRNRTYQQVERAALTVRSTAEVTLDRASQSQSPACRAKANILANQFNQFDKMLDREMSRPNWPTGERAIHMTWEFCERYQILIRNIRGC